MMTDAEFDARSFDFLRWFQSYPGTTFHPDIGLVDLRIREAGRGIGAFLVLWHC
jgi:SET domain-containing protein 6